jgi:hypothetical protein
MDTETEARFASVEQQINILRGSARKPVLDKQETDCHLTMLLGIVTEQQRDLKTVLARLDQMDLRFDSIDRQLASILVLLQQGKPPTP